jgi:hypothetical protein
MRPQHDCTRDFWSWRPNCDLVQKPPAAGRLRVAPMIGGVHPWRQAAAACDRIEGRRLGPAGPAVGLDRSLGSQPAPRDRTSHQMFSTPCHRSRWRAAPRQTRAPEGG